MTNPETTSWIKESRPFPAFLRTCSDLELVTLQHEARVIGDAETLADILAELKRRVEAKAVERP